MKYLLCLLLMSCITVAKAQRDTSGPLAGFRVLYENDVFNSTDYYYTEGLRLEFSIPYLQRTFVRYGLLTLPGGTDERIGLSLNQYCFTPRTLRSDTLLLDDRPFAGALYLGIYRSSVNPKKRMRLTSELDLGVAGPCAKCAETQRAAHEALDNATPLGWQNQLGNGPAINYGIRFEQGLVTSDVFEFSAYGVANAGTLYDNGGLGVSLRIGLLDEAYSKADPEQPFAIFLVGSGEGRAIIYDATYEGTVGSGKSIYRLSASEMERVVARGDVGFAMRYHRWELGYKNVWIGPEFRTGITHSWGQVNLGYIY